MSSSPLSDGRGAGGEGKTLSSSGLCILCVSLREFCVYVKKIDFDKKLSFNPSVFSDRHQYLLLTAFNGVFTCPTFLETQIKSGFLNLEL